MRRPYASSSPWNLVSPEISIKAGIRPRNTIILMILAFIVLGAFVAGIGAKLEHNTAARTDKSPSASRQHVLAMLVRANGL